VYVAIAGDVVNREVCAFKKLCAKTDKESTSYPLQATYTAKPLSNKCKRQATEIDMILTKLK
jgi:hypothetical protein